MIPAGLIGLNYLLLTEQTLYGVAHASSGAAAAQDSFHLIGYWAGAAGKRGVATWWGFIGVTLVAGLAGGMGMGIDRLCMMLLGQESIRDVILFPQLKPKS